MFGRGKAHEGLGTQHRLDSDAVDEPSGPAALRTLGRRRRR
jgi:hypothetical protein